MVVTGPGAGGWRGRVQRQGRGSLIALGVSAVVVMVTGLACVVAFAFLRAPWAVLWAGLFALLVAPGLFAVLGSRLGQLRRRSRSRDAGD